MKRGEVWVAQGPGYAGKPRPVVIVQDKQIDEFDSIVLCLLTSQDAGLPLRVKIEPSSKNGLSKTSWAMTEKVMAIPKRSLDQCIGRLEQAYLEEIGQKLAALLGL